MAFDWEKQIDPMNFAIVKLQTFFNDTKLGDATGFFHYGLLDNNPNRWLVTNWHVLTGRSADDPAIILHTHGALPNRLKLSLVLKPNQPEYQAAPDNQTLVQEQSVELYDANGRAAWSQHQSKNEFDVAVINPGAAFDRFHILGVNEVAQQNDMAIQIGNEVFIPGYPLGFSHFANTPIWKRGSIASEPIFETPETGSRVIVDATTRSGMSGAPVIMRAKTHYLAESGEIKAHPNATRWIGLYASRPNLAPANAVGEEDRRAEVGYFYKMRCVHDTIMAGIRGPDFGSLP